MKYINKNNLKKKLLFRIIMNPSFKKILELYGIFFKKLIEITLFLNQREMVKDPI